MQLITFATSLLACSTLAAAKHHSGFGHTVTKRTSASQVGAEFIDIVTGVIEVAGLFLRRRDGSLSTNASSVVYSVDLQLPPVGGPFAYHVHVNHLDASGNCASAGAHLDPANRTETPPCDPTVPETCQAGDLSGKYGKINGTCASFSITDPYTSLIPGLNDSIVGRSMVIHSANGTRIACANLTLLSAETAYSSCASGNTSNSSSPTRWVSWNPDATIRPSIYTGGADAGPGASLTSTVVLLAGVVLGGWTLKIAQ